MSAAAGVWLAIWLLRGLSSSRNGNQPSRPQRGEQADGILVALLLFEGLIVVPCAIALGGWKGGRSEPPQRRGGAFAAAGVAPRAARLARPSRLRYDRRS